MLTVDGLVSGYGKSQVVRDLSLQVEKGSLCVVLGTNGVGKSTLLKTIAGIIRPMAGRILLDDQDIAGMPSHSTFRKGLVLVPQGRELFPLMTVKEHLQLGYRRVPGGQSFEELQAAAIGLFPALGERLSQFAGTLSGGEQQMVAIGRALMSSPSLLLLDEPSLGVSPKLVSEMFAAVTQLRMQKGLTVLLVEQNVEGSVAIADHVYVLGGGRIVHSGHPDDLDVQSIVATYMGVA